VHCIGATLLFFFQWEYCSRAVNCLEKEELYVNDNLSLEETYYNTSDSNHVDMSLNSE
jgi:hypothetical protein